MITTSWRITSYELRPDWKRHPIKWLRWRREHGPCRMLITGLEPL